MTKKYKCLLSWEEIIEAETEDEAMEKFLEVIDGLGFGWEQDNTKIEEIIK